MCSLHPYISILFQTCTLDQGGKDYGVMDKFLTFFLLLFDVSVRKLRLQASFFFNCLISWILFMGMVAHVIQS